VRSPEWFLGQRFAKCRHRIRQNPEGVNIRELSAWLKKILDPVVVRF
jgi:hypothetical protein